MPPQNGTTSLNFLPELEGLMCHMCPETPPEEIPDAACARETDEHDVDLGTSCQPVPELCIAELRDRYGADVHTTEAMMDNDLFGPTITPSTLEGIMIRMEPETLLPTMVQQANMQMLSDILEPPSQILVTSIPPSSSASASSSMLPPNVTIGAPSIAASIAALLPDMIKEHPEEVKKQVNDLQTSVVTAQRPLGNKPTNTSSMPIISLEPSFHTAPSMSVAEFHPLEHMNTVAEANEILPMDLSTNNGRLPMDFSPEELETSEESIEELMQIPSSHFPSPTTEQLPTAITDLSTGSRLTRVEDNDATTSFLATAFNDILSTTETTSPPMTFLSARTTSLPFHIGEKEFSDIFEVETPPAATASSTVLSTSTTDTRDIIQQTATTIVPKTGTNPKLDVFVKLPVLQTKTNLGGTKKPVASTESITVAITTATTIAPTTAKTTLPTTTATVTLAPKRTKTTIVRSPLIMTTVTAPPTTTTTSLRPTTTPLSQKITVMAKTGTTLSPTITTTVPPTRRTTTAAAATTTTTTKTTTTRGTRTTKTIRATTTRATNPRPPPHLTSTATTPASDSTTVNAVEYVVHPPSAQPPDYLTNDVAYQPRKSTGTATTNYLTAANQTVPNHKKVIIYLSDGHGMLRQLEAENFGLSPPPRNTVFVSYSPNPTTVTKTIATTEAPSVSTPPIPQTERQLTTTTTSRIMGQNTPINVIKLPFIPSASLYVAADDDSGENPENSVEEISQPYEQLLSTEKLAYELSIPEMPSDEYTDQITPEADHFFTSDGIQPQNYSPEMPTDYPAASAVKATVLAASTPVPLKSNKKVGMVAVTPAGKPVVTLPYSQVLQGYKPVPTTPPPTTTGTTAEARPYGEVVSAEIAHQTYSRIIAMAPQTYRGINPSNYETSNFDDYDQTRSSEETISGHWNSTLIQPSTKVATSSPPLPSSSSSSSTPPTTIGDNKQITINKSTIVDNENVRKEYDSGKIGLSHHRPNIRATCLDKHELCCFWATMGECNNNPYWMRTHCAKTCGTCNCTLRKAKECVSTGIRCFFSRTQTTTATNHISTITSGGTRFPDNQQGNISLAYIVPKTTNFAATAIIPSTPYIPRSSDIPTLQLITEAKFRTEPHPIFSQATFEIPKRTVRRTTATPQVTTTATATATTAAATTTTTTATTTTNLPPTKSAVKTTPTPETCLDHNRHCKFWADLGECERNPFWMKPNCQKSCRSCGMVFDKIYAPTPRKGCTNDHRYCQFWAFTGECELNPGYMQIHCRLSCQFC